MTFMKKIIAAVTALLICSASLAGICSAKSQRFISTEELSGMIGYLNGITNDTNNDQMDMNSDNSVDIRDLILMKETINEDYVYYRHIGSRSDYEKDSKDTLKLSSMAETVSNTINDLLIKESSGTDKAIISSEDKSELTESVNTTLREKYGYKNLKWIAKRSFLTVSYCICTKDGEKIGAYPYEMKEDLNIPFDLATISLMENADFEWNKIFRNTTELNDDASKLAMIAESALISMKIRKEIPDEEFKSIDTVSSEDDGILKERISKACNTTIPYSQASEWTVTFKNGVIASAVISDFTKNKTGAYPASVPQSLDVPYSKDLNSYACGTEKWKDSFENSISADPERRDLADYCNVTDKEALIKAYLVFSNMKLLQESDEKYTAADGTYDSRQAYEKLMEYYTSPIFRSSICSFAHEHYIITIKDQEVSSVKYINEAQNIESYIDIPLMTEIEKNSTKKSISSSSSCAQTTFSTSKPTPDYALYYNTDDNAEDKATIILRPSKQSESGWVVSYGSAISDTKTVPVISSEKYTGSYPLNSSEEK